VTRSPQLGQSLRLPGDAMLQRHENTVARRGRVPHGVGSAEDPRLVQYGDAQTRLTHNAPTGRRQTAVDQPEQGRLAGAITPHDAPALARSDVERDVAQERGRAELHRDVGKGQDGHGGNMAGEGATRRRSRLVGVDRIFPPCRLYLAEAP